MANNISGFAWRIDTASPSPVKSGGGPVFVNAIEFSGYAAGTDKAIVTQLDAAGNIVTTVTLQGNTTLSPVSTSLGYGQWIRGLAVPTITAGQVTVYTK